MTAWQVTHKGRSEVKLKGLTRMYIVTMAI